MLASSGGDVEVRLITRKEDTQLSQTYLATLLISVSYNCIPSLRHPFQPARRPDTYRSIP